jgi:uncharacterized protein
VPNRLAESTSPYLLQHKDNPVDWYEWGDDAFAAARDRGVPILLSVGYAACHWCHVMAHESFEDTATAELMNRHFVSVKVDREERPDVDAVYMEAVQAMTGHGGWPMTAFLTPDGEPFYAGTYFPPRPTQGMPSFTQVLTAIAQTWDDDRASVGTAARSIAERLRSSAGVGDLASGAAPTDEDLTAAVRGLVGQYDRVAGGFGGAPKFPPSMVLEFLLRNHAVTGNPLALEMVEGTCEAMARGGMYDQLGGGFARYSVDAAWVVPHFEKMLYDNALLLRVYAHWWRATGAPLAERVVREAAQFLLRDLRTPQGGFASALDADTAGEEGLTYVWTPAQIVDVLGADDGGWAADLLSVNDSGTFEHGTSTLQLRREPDDETRWLRVREQLLAARAERPQPARDDKVVAAWNGLAVAALAEAGALFEEPSWLAAATAAAELLVSVHMDRDSGSSRWAWLRRVSRDGVVGRHAGVLEDQGDVAEGFLALFSATGEARWLTLAGALLDEVLAHFRDRDGTLHDTADDAEQLLRRPLDPTDNATPSGTSAAAGALLSYAAVTGSSAHRDAAGHALAVYAPLARRYPRFAGWGLAVAQAALDGPREVAVVGDPADAGFRAMVATARRGTAPGLVLATGRPGPSDVPLLADRPARDGRATAYVCRHFVCDAPTTDPAELAAAVSARGEQPSGTLANGS